MLRFLKKVTQRELEDINEQLRLNASNNYRDATLDNLKELETKYRDCLLYTSPSPRDA